LLRYCPQWVPIVNSFLEEFIVVVDNSTKVRISIIVATVTPAIILVLGSWVADRLQTEGAYAALLGALREPFIWVFAGLALVSFLRCATAVSRTYRRERIRLLGL
jgi:hypothetical protein